MENKEGAVPVGLFTEEQLEYVNSIKDENLRDELLYQIRLRDNSSNSNKSLEKEANDYSKRIIELKDKLILMLDETALPRTDKYYEYHHYNEMQLLELVLMKIDTDNLKKNNDEIELIIKSEIESNKKLKNEVDKLEKIINKI